MAVVIILGLLAVIAVMGSALYDMEEKMNKIEQQLEGEIKWKSN